MASRDRDRWQPQAARWEEISFECGSRLLVALNRPTKQVLYFMWYRYIIGVVHEISIINVCCWHYITNVCYKNGKECWFLSKNNKFYSIINNFYSKVQVYTMTTKLIVHSISAYSLCGMIRI